MTEKHRLAISRGLRKLRKRRRLSAAMKASWVRRRQTENAPEVRNNNTMPKPEPLNTHQLIAILCRKFGLEFTLGQLDDLVILCDEFHQYRVNETH